MRCALGSAQPVRVVGRDSNELGVWIGCSQFDKCSRVKHIKEVFLYLFTLSKLSKAEILITMFSNFHSRTVHRGIIKVFTPNDAQVFDMYMSYRWRESYNTVRFVTSSQRGLTCVGAECGKEGGGMDHTSVAALTNQLCSGRGVVRVFEYSINVLYYKYGRNQS